MIEIILRDIYDTFSYLNSGLVAAVCAGFLFAVGKCSRYGAGGRQGAYISLLAKSMFLAFYGMVLLQVTLLSREPGSRIAVDLLPFSTWGTTAQSRAYQIENLILFLPVGAFLPLLHGRLQKGCSVALTLTLLSVGIELAQFVTQRGYLQTDDVLMNVLGGMVGYAFWRLVFGLVAVKRGNVSA